MCKLILSLLGLLMSVSCNSYTFENKKAEISKKNYILTHVAVTCYQPLESQCDSDPLVTADGSKINLKKLKNKEIKWCAVSRDLLWLFPKDKPKRVHIEGFGDYEVRDVMNKKWNHRVDILIHPTDKERYHLKNVKMKIIL